MVIASLSVVPAAQARSSYCSPTGDYCTSVVTKRGAIYLKIGTFSFSGRYRLCVTPPRGKTSCESFRLRAGKYGIYNSAIRWSRHFPRAGKGTYRVKWKLGRDRLGPLLSFTRG